MATTDTGEIATVVEGLVALVRAAPPEILSEIAGGDSYAMAGDYKRHLSALRAVVDEFDCRLDRQPDNHWYPREPIELISYSTDPEDTLAVCVANALLMISDLEGDEYDYMDYRWHKAPGRAFFEALPVQFRDPLMAGFDVLRARWKRDGWL